MKVICELDNMCHGEKSLMMRLEEYQVYDWGGKEICEIVDQLYMTYLKGDELEGWFYVLYLWTIYWYAFGKKNIYQFFIVKCE